MPGPATPDPGTVRSVSRRLWELVEPLVGAAELAPETAAAYARLGLEGPWAGPLCGRAAVLGAAPGEAVAAALAVYDPRVVVPAVAGAWATTAPEAVLEARCRAAGAALERMSVAGPGAGRATELLVRAGAGARPEGRPLFAALRARPRTGDPVCDLWWAADVVREHRAGSQVLAWTALHLSPVEVILLTELWWRQPPGSLVGERGWPEEQTRAGLASLRARDFVAGDPPAFTGRGEELRGVVEEMTDRGQAELVAALGPGAEELFGLLGGAVDRVLAAGGYPADPAGYGRG